MAEVFHKIENKWLTVTAAEEGAQLGSIRTPDGTEYLWQGDAKYWEDRAITIFPYVARLTQGNYYMDGKLYKMNNHGFAAGQRFRLAERTEESMTLELEDNEETYAQYPRHFVFRIIYSLQENTLEVRFVVENKDEKPMYFGIGGHPGFNVPLTPEKEFTDYRLRFHEACQPVRVGFTEKCFLNGQDRAFALEEDRILPLSHDLFDEDAIVWKGMTDTITLETPGDSRSVTVRYPDMPYLGIWHMPKTDAPYVCIEPWRSLPSTQDEIAVFEEQEDLVKLESGQTYENVWTITIGN